MYDSSIIYRRVRKMDKQQILAALNAIQESGDAGQYHDELETLIGVVSNAKDEDISAAWDCIHEDN
jgi:hypothetical protein